MSEMDCDGYINRRVKLGYVPDAPTSVKLVDSIDKQIFDLLPIIRAGETDTSIRLLPEIRRIRYYPERYTWSEGEEGCYYDICIPDLAGLIYLNELADVEKAQPEDGETIVYNADEKEYKMYNLLAEINNIYKKIKETSDKVDGYDKDFSSIEQKITELTNRINRYYQDLSSLDLRIKAIEDAIYDWDNDKATKIPRATVNFTTNGIDSGNGIYCRPVDQDYDANFR